MKNPHLNAKGTHQFLHGADYNPEQWYLDPAIMADDFQRMQDAGCTSMSVGIFSWTLYEPEEGRYEFGWMDTILDGLAKHGIKAFLATPSGGKPLWMSEKYPEIRQVQRNGLRQPSGQRHNHCPSSPVYRDKIQQLNSRLAQHYAGHPALALWHVSNELQGECFCPICLEQFQTWLEVKYGTLGALNEAWWARFWNHTFTDWRQIDPRDTSIDGMVLDWRRFTNELHVSFLENEITPLREYTPDIPCTTNFMGFCSPLDYWRWSQVLDLISNDAYPSYDGGEEMWRDAAGMSLTHDLMRGLAQGKPWMQIECTPSIINWRPINKQKPPGVHHVEVAQAIAHGADSVHYFQFRKGRGGFEKFHGAIVDHDSRSDTRVFREVSEVGAWLDKLQPVAGSLSPRAEVAFLHDWESQWALNSSCGIRQPEPNHLGPRDAYHVLLHEHYCGWWHQNIPVDVLWPDAANFAEVLRDRQVVVAPCLYLLKKNVAQTLLDFVRRGGCLVISHLSGVVDEFNRVLLGGLPGCGWHEAAGAKVEEIDALFAHEELTFTCEALLAELRGEYKIHQAYGLLHLQGAQALAKPTQGPWVERAIASHHLFGEGEIFVLAANFCDAFYRDFAAFLAQRRKLARPVKGEIPLGVHATTRVSTQDGRSYVFLINYTPHTQAIALEGKLSCVDGFEGDIDAFELKPFGVYVGEPQ